ncbi:hypothetical protein OEZ85_003881 [Tetradesmus obliquus]|uniref:Uncharacterized protein n=2 Tax=Tetradesmus obliquus TaxID=3088 RepID=A0ABY8UDA1_TETOB|nr:hypothetical protein OEZ85_003881 [Tetradesmus obliquus]
MASLASKHSISTASVHRPAPALLAPRVLPQRHCPVHTRSSLADKIKHSLDFNKKGRLEVIDKLYRNPSKASLEAVLADDFKMGEEGYTKKFTKADYIGLTAGVVLPAIPDFKWGHACSGDVDDDGFCIVTVQATGHHTGAPLAMPGLEPLPPSGRHFCLAEEVQKVKVVGDKVAEIQVLPNKGAGPRALYAALGGKAPSQAAAAAAAAAPPLP